MAWLLLIGAIVLEVVGTLSLRMAALSAKRWFIAVAVSYLIAFTLLALAIANGMPVGVAYGMWAAGGIVLTAVLSKILFDEPLNWIMAIGIVLIVGGVLLVQVGAPR